jgi:HK97 family phage major capsid protein
MALTLVEASKLSNDTLLAGVIETIAAESPVLQRLPFVEITGNGLTYNRENAAPTATFYDVGDTWTEATPTFTQVTAALKIMGGDADVDNFLQATYADPNDIEAEVIASRAKSVAYKYNEAFITGDSAVDTKSFDGLRKVIGTGPRSIAIATNGGPLTLDKMDEVIDLVKPGRPDALLMSKRSRRKLSALRRASGNLLEVDRTDFGRRALFYDGIPIVVDDNQPDNEVEGTSGAVCSSIYPIKFGQAEGVMGLEHGGIDIEEIGELETKDATRHRIKWYASLAVFSELGVARLRGITAA